MKIYKNQFSAGSSTVAPRRVSTRTEPTRSYGRGQNQVRHTPVKRSALGQVGLAVGLVMVIGLVFLSQTGRITEYDVKMHDMDKQITELTKKKADLALENARATSRSTLERSELADTMVRPSDVSSYRNE
jgi:hypothetical protein